MHITFNLLQVNITPSIHSSGEFPQLLHHGVNVGSLPLNESYLLAQQNGSPTDVLEASMRSITPQINGKFSNDGFEQLIRNMSQVTLSYNNQKIWITDYMKFKIHICLLRSKLITTQTTKLLPV